MSKNTYFGPIDGALDVIMAQTGCTRRQAKAKLQTLVRQGKIRSRLCNTVTGEQQELPPAYGARLIDKPAPPFVRCESVSGVFMDPVEDGVKLGCCCICRGEIGVRNIIMLPLRAPVPGTGWGCVICHLPPDGAVAVVCDECLGEQPLFACDGYPKDGGRIAVELLDGPFEHDPLVDHDNA